MVCTLRVYGPRCMTDENTEEDSSESNGGYMKKMAIPMWSPYGSYVKRIVSRELRCYVVWKAHPAACTGRQRSQAWWCRPAAPAIRNHMTEGSYDSNT